MTELCGMWHAVELLLQSGQAPPCSGTWNSLGIMVGFSCPSPSTSPGNSMSEGCCDTSMRQHLAPLAPHNRHESTLDEFSAPSTLSTSSATSCPHYRRSSPPSDHRRPLPQRSARPRNVRRLHRPRHRHHKRAVGTSVPVGQRIQDPRPQHLHRSSDRRQPPP